MGECFGRSICSGFQLKALPSSSGCSQPSDVQTQVHFHVAWNAGVGEVVRIVGNHPQLGNWDPAYGLVLATDENIYPCWVTKEPLVVSLHQHIEYQYVLVATAGNVLHHESLQHNRQFVASGTEMTVEDDNGLYRRKAGDEEDEDDDLEEVLPMRLRQPSVQGMSLEEKLKHAKNLEGKVSLNNNVPITIVSIQLPVKLVRRESGWAVDSSTHAGGKNFALLSLLHEWKERTSHKVMIVGWPGVHVECNRERQEIEKLLLRHDCVAVWPPQEEFADYVDFCKTFLWPVFHDSMLGFQTTNVQFFSDTGWAAYTYINNVYARTVVRHTHESGIIWIQDYHLLMTPTFIARKVQKANIGLYLHTPFPSSDSFKSLPVREELLSGIFSCDQIGFQFFDYARAFLVSAKRIYGLDPTFPAGGFMGLEYNGRMIMIKVAHFPYPYQNTKLLVSGDQVALKVARLRHLFEGKIVFASVDRCDGLSGLILKFRAFKRFLRDHPQYVGKAVLVQYTLTSTLSNSSQAAGLEISLRAQADAFLDSDGAGGFTVMSNRDEGESETSSVHSIYMRVGSLDRMDQLALFRTANVLLDTSVKAGLNLMPFEFITAHFDNGEQEQSRVAIVSEFSGCSRVLMGALRVNPWNTNELASACERAITMPQSEKKERLESNLLYISENQPVRWFEEFVTDLRRAQTKEGMLVEHIGFGTKLRAVVMNQKFKKLDSSEVLRSFNTARNRVLFFDNEGTLAADVRHHYREYGAPQGDVSDLKSHGTSPSEQVLMHLRTLCADNRNTVVILSGRDQKMLEQWFGSVPRIGLAAEHGFYWKLPQISGDQWNCAVQDVDTSWKTYAFELMRTFVKRTQGSFIENKGSALVWQYRDADQHFGSWQAKELTLHLKELLFGWELEVIAGKGYVEVKTRGVNKGVAVNTILEKVTQECGTVDFALCIGDDRSDEDMFEALNQFIDPGEAELKDNSSLSTAESEHSDHETNALQFHNKFGRQAFSTSNLSGLASLGGNLSTCHEFSGKTPPRRQFFTCTIGRKPSAAKFFLDDVDEVSDLLSQLQWKKRRLASKEQYTMPAHHTWSGGDGFRRQRRIDSMPALASLSPPEFGTDPGLLPGDYRR